MAAKPADEDRPEEDAAGRGVRRARRRDPEGRRDRTPVDPPAAAESAAPLSAPEGATDDPVGAETWEPAATVDHRPRRWGRWVILMLLPVLVVAGLVIIPPLLPKDPRAKVIEAYLEAAKQGNWELLDQYGVLDEPPRTEWVGRLRAVQEEPTVIARGPFRPLRELHQYVESTYRRQGDVYLLADQTPVLAGLINQYADARRKGQAIADKMMGSPDDLFDAAEELAQAQLGVFDTLFGFNPNAAPGTAQPKPLVLTYDQVIERWGQKLSPEQRLLAESIRDHLDRWRRLVGRDPREINADDEFVVTEHYWDGAVMLPGQSWGEEPRKVRFTLRRFQLGLLDSGWKVWEIKVLDP